MHFAKVEDANVLENVSIANHKMKMWRKKYVLAWTFRALVHFDSN